MFKIKLRVVFYRLNILNALSHRQSNILPFFHLSLLLSFISSLIPSASAKVSFLTTGFNRNGEVISSLLSGGPLGEFHGLVQLYHLVLEHFDLGGTSTLDIEDESVHQAVVGL